MEVKEMLVTHILTTSSTTTGCAIEEILLQTIADACAKLRAGTTNCTARAIARIGVIATGVAAHDGLALLVTAGALARRTLETIAAI